jgi:hypothetical protein
MVGTATMAGIGTIGTAVTGKLRLDSSRRA